jgi:DNA-directed RNA polymerase subunit RPC12/RpoP
MRMIRLQMFEYSCGSCGRGFSAPELVAGDYLLLRSEGVGSLALVPTVDNAVLDEVDRLVQELPVIRGRSDLQVGGATQEALSAVFDPDEDGSRFVVGGRPRCPHCGWREPSGWRASEPPEFVDVDVPLAAHTGWDNLGSGEKQSRIADAVADALSA